jgi:hypothetical protein
MHVHHDYTFDFGKFFIYLHITNIIRRINTDYSLKGFNRFVFFLGIGSASSVRSELKFYALRC